MRDIKFRAWDKDAVMWAPLDTIFVGGSGRVSRLLIDFDARTYFNKHLECENVNVEICRATGLKDKNGKEIYEGDIVRFMYNSTPQTQRIGEVKWNEGYCSWTFDALLIEPTPRKTIEVIGNIYENPELIQK